MTAFDSRFSCSVVIVNNYFRTTQFCNHCGIPSLPLGKEGEIFYYDEVAIDIISFEGEPL